MNTSTDLDPTQLPTVIAGGRQAAIASGLGWALVLLSLLSGLLGHTELVWTAQLGFAIAAIFLGVRSLWRDRDAPRSDRRLAWLGAVSGVALLLVSALEVLVIIVSLSHD